METWNGPRVGIVIDCNDIEKMSEFWAAALEFKLSSDAGHYRSLTSSQCDEPRVLLQQVREPRRGKNRLHVDIHVNDIEVASQRIVGLGARRLDQAARDEVDSRWIRLEDPEGNQFCVVEAR